MGKSLNLQNYASSISLGANYTGTAIDMNVMALVSFVAVISSSSSPVGTLTLQVSNDNSNWVTSGTTASVSADGNLLLNLGSSASRYARLIYTRTSGSATLNVAVHAKEA